MSERQVKLHHIHDFAQRAGMPCVGRELAGERGRVVFKLREPSFKRFEKKLAGLPGTFNALPPEGFAVQFPAYLLDEENLEETVVRILKRLA